MKDCELYRFYSFMSLAEGKTEFLGQGKEKIMKYQENEALGTGTPM